MADTHRWLTPVVLTDGHRLFPSEADPYKNVAIADDSGREPQDTDDGVLWLDFERPLMISNSLGNESFTIPLLSNYKDFTRTVTDASTLLYLSAAFKWAIVDQRNDGAIYKVEAQ